MASAITLEGIDQAISNLEYKNKNTLKYRFVQHIRQYYTCENSVLLLNEVDHEALIKKLWDTDLSLEAVKNKRKNLNSVRSSVNSDLKKLYEKGKNPEGIKIGSNNIFVMSEDAKDKILKKLGHDIPPDDTLKLDQIMDILKLANEAVSGSMALEDPEKKDGVKKIDRLKDLVKGLSEKVGLASPELSKGAIEPGGAAGKGDEGGSGSLETAEVFEEALPEEVEDVADLEDEIEYVDVAYEEELLDDVEDVEDIIDPKDQVEYVDIADEEEILDDVEDAETDDIEEGIDIEEDVEDVAELEDEIEYVDVADEEALLDRVEDAETDDIDEAVEIEEDVEKVFDDEDEELDDVEDDAHDVTEGAEYSLEEGKGQKGNDQLGLPVDSLGREYSIEADSKLKKNKLLAEEFDGHLGSMDRYYNQYILIPGGEYIIGNKHPKKDEKPEQKVYLEPFYFGRFPITNGLFEIFIEKTGYKTTAEKVGYGTVYYGRFEKRKDETTGLMTSIWNASIYCKTVEGACWYQPSGPKSTLYSKRNHPVVQISLEDAMAFAAWTGKRLPTENEWEAASRTANGWIFPWGQDWKKDACNIEDSYIADTTPVDKYIKFENDFGIVDILGNVLEWTDNSFEEMQQTNNREKYKAVRGGSWISGNDIRLYSRFMKEPDSHSNIVGFRCVAY